MPSSTFELVLGRLAQFYAPAAELYRVCNEILASRGNSASIAHTIRTSKTTSAVEESIESLRQRLQQFKIRYLNQHAKLQPSATAMRVLWVRLALVEKMMAGLVNTVLQRAR